MSKLWDESLVIKEGMTDEEEKAVYAERYRQVSAKVYEQLKLKRNTVKHRYDVVITRDDGEEIKAFSIAENAREALVNIMAGLSDTAFHTAVTKDGETRTYVTKQI